MRPSVSFKVANQRVLLEIDTGHFFKENVIVDIALKWEIEKKSKRFYILSIYDENGILKGIIERKNC